MPEASVIIATRNRAGFLRECLTRLARQTVRERIEIVVVDNGSTDDTAAIVTQACSGAMPVRRIFVSDPNRGKARNAGVAAAKADTIVFCDDDTLAPEGFVEAHLRAHSNKPRSVVSGPIVNVPDAEHLTTPGPQHFSRAFLCTCNASVARADLEAVGGFDERYDLYGWEDTDLGVRLHDRGAERVWSWDAYIYHVKPPVAMSLEKRIALASEKGAMAARFLRKSPSLKVKLATGAYALNFARASIVGAKPLRRWYARLTEGPADEDSPLRRLAADALVDAAYVDALRAGMLRRDG